LGFCLGFRIWDLEFSFMDFGFLFGSNILPLWRGKIKRCPEIWKTVKWVEKVDKRKK